MQRLTLVIGGVLLLWAGQAWGQTQNWCVPPDPDYCVARVCQAGEGDCDPGQCAAGLVCVNDVGAQYGLPAHYDVCETRSAGRPDPDYCVYNYCGIGDGDCDPGQCDEGTCVNDVGAEYGLPAYYDVCEAPDNTGGGGGATSGVGQFVGTWRFTNNHTTKTYRFARVETCRGNPAAQCVYDETQGLAALGAGQVPGYSYRYLLAHQDNTVCRLYFLNEPTGNTVTGHYGYGFGDCLAQDTIASAAGHIDSRRYPTTGRRISQSAASVSAAPSETIPPPVEMGANVEDAIETLMDAMMD